MINRPVMTRKAYTLLLSYFPEIDEYHGHIHMPHATPENFKNLKRDVEVMMEANAVRTIYSTAFPENKQTEKIMRLTGFNKIGTIEGVDGTVLDKYIKEI